MITHFRSRTYSVLQKVDIKQDNPQSPPLNKASMSFSSLRTLIPTSKEVNMPLLIYKSCLRMSWAAKKSLTNWLAISRQLRT